MMELQFVYPVGETFQRKMETLEPARAPSYSPLYALRQGNSSNEEWEISKTNQTRGTPPKQPRLSTLVENSQFYVKKGRSGRI